MRDTNHYIVTADDTNVEIHTRNISESNANQAIKTGVQDFVCDSANGVFFAEVFNVSDSVDLYRRMCAEEVKKALSTKGLVNDYAHKNKWVSESLSKAVEFQNNGVPESIQKTEQIVQMVVDKEFYTKFRSELIPQLQSSQYSKSVYHYEGIVPGRLTTFEEYENIPDTVERNIGVHTNDVKTVNQKITSIEVLDPNDPFVYNGFLRYLSTNKLKVGMFALSVTIDVTRIVLSVIEDSNRIGKSTTITICNLIGSKAGAAIGAAICSVVPGIGTVVGGILGGLIFGFVGTKIGTLLCGLFPEVASGQGPPENDYLQFIYGDNKKFAVPLPNYELDKETGLPKSYYERTGRITSEYSPGNVYGPPPSVYNNPSIYGPPPSYYQ